MAPNYFVRIPDQHVTDGAEFARFDAYISRDRSFMTTLFRRALSGARRCWRGEGKVDWSAQRRCATSALERTTDLRPKNSNSGSRAYRKIDCESVPKARSKRSMVTRFPAMRARAAARSCRRARRRRYVHGHSLRPPVVRDR